MTFKNIIVLLFGAILFVGWHFFIGLDWTKQASFDVVCGAIVEFYIFTYIVSEHEKREETKRADEMEKHLERIENLIKAKQQGGGNNDENL